MQQIRFCHVIDASILNPLLYNSIRYSDHSRFDYTVIGLALAEAFCKKPEIACMQKFASLKKTMQEPAEKAIKQLLATTFFRNLLLGLSRAAEKLARQQRTTNFSVCSQMLTSGQGTKPDYEIFDNSKL